MIYLKTFEKKDIDTKEVLRYAGCPSLDENTQRLLDECIDECKDIFTYNACYGKFPIEFKNGNICFPFTETDSTDLIKNLSGCKEVYIFAATVGISIDRLILKYAKISPAKAVFFQAIGAERTESLCDSVNDYIKTLAENDGLYTRPRFSPGYGDFPLSKQRDIFNALDCQRKIGLTLNESLMMSPSKSVTAIIGVSPYDCRAENGCDFCFKTNCEFKK